METINTSPPEPVKAENVSTAYAVALINSGERLRRLRESRFVKAGDIEQTSCWISDVNASSAYYISAGLLAELEGGSAPTIHQIHSLAVCLSVPCEQLLQIFGIDLKFELQSAELRRHYEGDAPISALDVQDNDNHSGETRLLAPNPEHWGEMGRAFATRLRPERFRYALIGASDDTMADMVAPGSLVEVDERQTDIESANWRSLRERPLYLVRYGNCFRCCWCQLHDGELTLVSHPLSQRKTMRFSTPEAARVLGKVVKVWMPLQMNSTQPQPDDRSSFIDSYLGQDFSSALAPAPAHVRPTRSVA